MQRSGACEVRFRFSTLLLAGISFHVVLDQGAEISGELGAAVAAQRAVVERRWWYVTKATSGSAVRCCVVPGHQGGAIYKLTSPSMPDVVSVVDFFWGGPVCDQCGCTRERGPYT
jgi:hypothetical protein